MHAARIAQSPRLQRALRALQARGGWMTTRQLIRAANICAVNSVIAELRANGAEIETRQQLLREGARRFSYRLIRAPEGWGDATGSTASPGQPGQETGNG